MTLALQIVPALPGDIIELAALERLAGDVKWNEAQICAELEKTTSLYFVARTPKQIVGYVGGWVIFPELQIANIVIHPDFRCQGAGRRLLTTLIETASARGCTFATLEVRASNAHAQSLYRRVGFMETGRRPTAYQNPDEAAVLMEKKWG